MKQITEEEAKKEFIQGGEIWVYTGDYGDDPMFEYEDEDEDGYPIIEDSNRIMHPKSIRYGDVVECLIYNNYYYNGQVYCK